MSRYRRWNELLELLAAARQLPAGEAAGDVSRRRDAGADVASA